MPSDLSSPPAAAQYVALTGNPNCGKTTLFNALTGLSAKVGNYAGVTVERKEGRLQETPGDVEITILDLPGTYSLSPKSLDEQIARDVLFHRIERVPAPQLVVVVVDASNLERNLYYATQVIELGYPTIVALNMMDVAANHGHRVDAARLSASLAVPVLPLVASEREGVEELRQKIVELCSPKAPRFTPRAFYELPAAFGRELDTLATQLTLAFPDRQTAARAEALLLLTDEKALASNAHHYPADVQAAVHAARERVTAAGHDWRSAVIEARYARIAEIQHGAVSEVGGVLVTASDKIDRVVTHRIWGLVIFLGLMALMFQSIFTFAKLPMDLLANTVDAFGNFVGGLMGPGDLNDLLVNGVIKGVGAVVVFLPQILLLFLFISLLEDTGYMARAAFLMDRVMGRVGLHGKSFIPMLSSFACAIPGIMATRTIESQKDRLVTILVAPLMSCSARLPVYTVLIAACIPDVQVFGFWKLSGIVMLAMYLLGIVVALLMAMLFKKTLLKGDAPLLIMELPPYKRPVLAVTLRHMWDRSKLFLRRAGTVILGINILLWFLATYPKDATLADKFAAEAVQLSKVIVPNHDEALSPRSEFAAQLKEFVYVDSKEVSHVGPGQRAARHPSGGTTYVLSSPEINALEKLKGLDAEEQGEKLRHSFAGRLGRLIEPAIEPLGFDWKMGIGIVASFAAREVFVSTMSVVYNVGDYDKTDASTTRLAKVLQAQKDERGRLVYTPLRAVTLMVFYVFALQCVSTVAVVRRETASWKWPLFQWFYMAVLAWGLAFLTRQFGMLFGAY